MKIDVLALRGRTPLVSLGILLFCAALPPAAVANGGAPAPVKLAIFDFELEDFSAGGPLIGESAADADQLKLATSEARRLVGQSGRYSLVDVSAADSEPVKVRSLRNCDGCDAGIASKLGADQTLVGTITRISRTEYTVAFQIRDARDGALICNQRTDLRMGANYSWSRGVAWLINNRLLNGEDPR